MIKKILKYALIPVLFCIVVSLIFCDLQASKEAQTREYEEAYGSVPVTVSATWPTEYYKYRINGQEFEVPNVSVVDINGRIIKVPYMVMVDGYETDVSRKSNSPFVPAWVVDLLSGEVLIDRMKAEESMGLKEEALETCGRAAATFQVFIQAHSPTQEHPLDKMNAGELENLERAYASIVPLFSKMGADKADLVVRFGQAYMEMFPNGKDRTEISNCINKAKADMPAK